MANRRMLSQDIVSSDAFLDMPVSSQVLYFHLAMRADDDGFVSPKMVMRLIGSSNDDLKVLIAKRFLLPFDSGVVVIKHWLVHNLIRADLYKETMYKKEKSTLGLNENGAYTELRDGVSELKKIEPPKWLKQRRKELRTANVPKTAHRIGKDRLGKDISELPPATSQGEDFSISSGGYEIVPTNEHGEQISPRKKKETTTNAPKVFELFRRELGVFTAGWIKNKTERQAAETLWVEKGGEQVVRALRLYCENRDLEYIPDVSSPYALLNKWTKLKVFKEKHGL